jgi:acyl-CoA synthetase (AMP-forming)/AMP-acid ligase II
MSADKVRTSVHIVLELPLTQYGKIGKPRIRAQLVEQAGNFQQ